MRPLLVAAVLFTVAASARAADPSIDHVTATAANGKVSVRFSLERGFERDQTIQGLQSGVPTSFTYVVELSRDRPNWFDEGLGRSRIEVIATFNSVTREYLMNYRRDRRLVRSETFSDFAALQHRMSNIEEHELFDIGSRPPYKLRLRVKADLMRGWLFYFIPWEFSTRWRSVHVTGAEKP